MKKIHLKNRLYYFWLYIRYGRYWIKGEDFPRFKSNYPKQLFRNPCIDPYAMTNKRSKKVWDGGKRTFLGEGNHTFTLNFHPEFDVIVKDNIPPIKPESYRMIFIDNTCHEDKDGVQ